MIIFISIITILIVLIFIIIIIMIVIMINTIIALIVTTSPPPRKLGCNCNYANRALATGTWSLHLVNENRFSVAELMPGSKALGALGHGGRAGGRLWGGRIPIPIFSDAPWGFPWEKKSRHPVLVNFKGTPFIKNKTNN